MEEYHGILVDASLNDKSIFRKLNILGQRKSSNDNWTLYRISVPPKDIDKAIIQIQDNLIDGFYFHFYKDYELIVVFKRRIFRIKTDKSTWKEAIEYGRSLGIPERQLDFKPCKVEEETY